MRYLRGSTPLVIVVAMLLAGCGSDSDGGSTAGFADDLAASCRDVAAELSAIEPAGTSSEYAGAAAAASLAYETGAARLDDLTAPDDSADDLAELRGNFAEAVDRYDALALAARDGNDDEVSAAVAELDGINSRNSELASSLGADDCALPAVVRSEPDPTDPPVTDPPATEPPDTDPPDTDRPDTDPPETEVVETDPESTDVTASDGEDPDGRVIVPVADTITPLGDYSFVDSDPSTVESIELLFDVAESTADASGVMFGVDVIDQGITITRVIGFVPDSGPLPADAVQDLSETLADSGPPEPLTLGEDTSNPLTGLTFTASGNLFVIADDDGTILIFVGKDSVSLAFGAEHFLESHP